MVLLASYSLTLTPPLPIVRSGETILALAAILASFRSANRVRAAARVRARSGGADRLLDAAIGRAHAVPADAMAAYAFTKRALQAPALANIERLADPLDDQLAKGFSDPGSLRVQRAKYEQLTGRVPDTEVG